jgi:hypothetical protein
MTANDCGREERARIKKLLREKVQEESSMATKKKAKKKKH